MSAVKIISRRPGFRRLGVEHPAEAVYAVDHWSADDLAVFEGDPNFTVVAHTGDTKDKVPDLEGDALIEAIREAIGKLKADEKPTVARISELVGQKVSGKVLGDVIKTSKEGD